MAFSPQAALDFLRRANEGGRLAHAYLITGDAGSGKRQLASRLAAMVNPVYYSKEADADPLRHPDVHAVEPESKSRVIRVEQTRELEKELQMRSSQGGRKVGILFDADRMNAAASNSFLKTLEEPPANSLLLLVTAHPEMLLDTILSRCILVQLTAAHLEPTPQQRRLLDILARFFQQDKAEISDVFRLVHDFTVALAEAKAAIQAEGEAEMKREEALYKQTTDGKWLADREDYFKGMAESRYMQTRALFVDTLLQWWGDILRQQHGATALDFPLHAAETAALAARMSTAEVLRRIGAIEELRENFNRTVQEQLAVEVAFLRAFGAEKSGKQKVESRK